MREILRRIEVQITLLAVVLLFYMGHTQATTFALPTGDDSLVGEMHMATIHPGENLGDFLAKNQIGYFELAEANPNECLDPPHGGTTYIIPTQYLLPDAPRHDIVINLSEPRLYYYPPSGGNVLTYPIGIGREGVNTPVIQTKIVEKRLHPIWVPTEATRKRDAVRGIKYPAFIPAGPGNPLGDYALRLGLRNYSIHGTNDPYGVGLRSSSGCIRMSENDIQELFSLISVGTKVNIVNQPVKIGLSQGILYAEVQRPMRFKGLDENVLEETVSGETAFEETARLLTNLLKEEEKKYPLEIDWEKAIAVARAQKGIPIAVGRITRNMELDPVYVLEAQMVKQ